MKYLALFLIITLGVASGNLISNWITAKAAARELFKAAEQMEAHIKMQDALAKREREDRAKRDAIIRQEQKNHQQKVKREREAADQAQQVKITTCKYWIEEYRRTNSEIDRNHRTNACKDAGIRVSN